MFWITRLHESIEHVTKKRPLTYYLFLVLMIAGMMWSILPGISVIWLWADFSWNLNTIVALLFVLLLIPEIMMLHFYFKQHESTLDFMNVSFLAAAFLNLLIANWVWVVVLLVFWYILSDFIRYKEWNGKYLFK